MKFKFVLTFVCIILFFLPLFAQNNLTLRQISGSITDKLDHPIPYVGLGILGKNSGTISDSLGNFNLKIPGDLRSDTLLISTLGYYPKKIALQEFNQNSNTLKIKLISKASQLKEVFVTSKKGREEIVGRKSESQFVQLSVVDNTKSNYNSNIGGELGTNFRARKYPVYLKDFNFFVLKNSFNRIKFKINIYSIKNNLPDSLLLKREIYSELSNQYTGWKKINLAKENIYLNSDFIITLQWIDNAKAVNDNQNFRLPAGISLGHSIFFRGASADKWNKIGVNISYYVTLIE